MTCKVSIIIPTKDRPNLVRQSVGSALRALPPEAEVIVVDDCSEIPAAESLSEIATVNVKLVRNEAPIGCSEARNLGASVALGEILMFLDDDDLLHRDYPSYILDVLRGSPNLEFGFSNTVSIPYEMSDSAALEGQSGAFHGHAFSDLPVRQQLFGLGCGFWIRKTLFDAIGGIDRDIAINEDTDLAIRLIASGRMGWHTQTPAAFIRRHPEETGKDLKSLTKRTNPGVRMDCFRRIFEKNRDFIIRNPSIERFVLYRFSKFAGRSGNCGTAWSLLNRERKYQYLPSCLAYFLLSRVAVSATRAE